MTLLRAFGAVVFVLLASIDGSFGITECNETNSYIDHWYHKIHCYFIVRIDHTKVALERQSAFRERDAGQTACAAEQARIYGRGVMASLIELSDIDELVFVQPLINSYVDELTAQNLPVLFPPLELRFSYSFATNVELVGEGFQAIQLIGDFDCHLYIPSMKKFDIKPCRQLFVFDNGKFSLAVCRATLPSHLSSVAIPTVVVPKVDNEEMLKLGLMAIGGVVAALILLVLLASLCLCCCCRKRPAAAGAAAAAPGQPGYAGGSMPAATVGEEFASNQTGTVTGTTFASETQGGGGPEQQGAGGDGGAASEAAPPPAAGAAGKAPQSVEVQGVAESNYVPSPGAKGIGPSSKYA